MYSVTVFTVLGLQEARSSSEYTPFGVGPKGCVGQYLAMIEMKAIMAQLLRRYRVTTATQDDDAGGLGDASQTLETVSTRWDIAQQPTTPTYMRIIPRPPRSPAAPSPVSSTPADECS